jgi:hypothetical protein
VRSRPPFYVAEHKSHAKGNDAMPRYMVEREFPDGLQIPVDETGANAYLAVIESNSLDRLPIRLTRLSLLVEHQCSQLDAFAGQRAGGRGWIHER